MTQNINRTRRSLLAGGTMAALAAATGAAHAKEGAPAFDKIYDVIVVGSGFAGLAAALQARLKGAEVLLIEKMPVFGGNSAINGGAFVSASGKGRHQGQSRTHASGHDPFRPRPLPRRPAQDDRRRHASRL